MTERGNNIYCIHAPALQENGSPLTMQVSALLKEQFLESIFSCWELQQPQRKESKSTARENHTILEILLLSPIPT